jgi:hypothetical protein
MIVVCSSVYPFTGFISKINKRISPKFDVGVNSKYFRVTFVLALVGLISPLIYMG